MNKRDCYCEFREKDTSGRGWRGIPAGYCGICQSCGRPGHTRHFPGAAPYTGSWCDTHYRRISLLHPLAFPGMLLYAAAIAILFLILWLAR